MHRPHLLSGKVDSNVAKTLATKPKLVEISKAYGQQQ
jgi:hypothetical protein